MSCILHNSLTSTFIRNSAWDEMQLLGIKYNITDLKRKCSFKYFVWSKLEHLVKKLIIFDNIVLNGTECL